MPPVPKPKKQPKKQKSRDFAHLDKVAALPCAVCFHFGLVQKSKTDVHHTIHGRFSQDRTPDIEAIPLCKCHHQGLEFDRDRSKPAIHAQPAEWVESYGDDVDYIAWTLDQID